MYTLRIFPSEKALSKYRKIRESIESKVQNSKVDNNNVIRINKKEDIKEVSKKLTKDLGFEVKIEEAELTVVKLPNLKGIIITGLATLKNNFKNEKKEEIISYDQSDQSGQDSKLLTDLKKESRVKNPIDKEKIDLDEVIKEYKENS